MANPVSDKIMKILQKLHALANCPTGNVNETAAAAARMSELMLQHGIESIGVAAPELQKHLALDKAAPVWQQSLLASLANAAGCRPLKHGKKEMWLIGDLGIAQAVEYQFKALLVDLKRLCVAYLGSRTAEYNSFYIGAAAEIGARLREMKKQATDQVRAQGGQEQALVWLEKGASNEDVLAVMGLGPGIRITNTKRRRQSVQSDAYDRGREAGRQVPLGSRASGALGSEKQALR